MSYFDCPSMREPAVLRDGTSVYSIPKLLVNGCYFSSKYKYNLPTSWAELQEALEILSNKGEAIEHDP